MNKLKCCKGQMKWFKCTQPSLMKWINVELKGKLIFYSIFNFKAPFFLKFGIGTCRLLN